MTVYRHKTGLKVMFDDGAIVECDRGEWTGDPDRIATVQRYLFEVGDMRFLP